jgi:hypothetical protein
LEHTVIAFVIVGFIAQLIDGTVGMGYGVTSTAFLLSLGIPPAPASASVHAAEVFTTGISGAFHLKFKNVDKNIFKNLVIPGVIGGILGAYILTSLPGEKIKPLVACYLLIMGMIILRKSFKEIQKRDWSRGRLFPLGLAGGCLDAIGGGGWGPIVTSTLVGTGNNPRFTIGSVNLAEFFVSVAEAATFFTIIGFVHRQIILGLIIGGVVAAPLAAYLCKMLPVRALMTLVGILIIVLSGRTLYKALIVFV